MAIDLDHMIVLSRDKIAAAQRVAEIFNVPWAEMGVGPFAPVFVSDRPQLPKVIFTEGAERSARPWNTASTLLPSGSSTKAAKYPG